MALPQVGYKESAKTPPTGDNALQTFVSRHQHPIQGTLSGFDRLRFVGTLRRLAFRDGLASFLAVTGVLLKDFGDYGFQLSKRIKQARERLARQTASGHCH